MGLKGWMALPEEKGMPFCCLCDRRTLAVSTGPEAECCSLSVEVFVLATVGTGWGELKAIAESER